MEETRDEELTNEEIGALFADELEPERVGVPGHPESWVELLPMDALAFNKYVVLAGPQPAPQVPKGAPLPAQDITRAVEFLLCETLVDWHLAGKNGTRTPPEPGRGDPERARKEAVKGLLREPGRGITAHLMGWIVNECLRVNHLTEADQGRRDEAGEETQPGN